MAVYDELVAQQQKNEQLLSGLQARSQQRQPQWVGVLGGALQAANAPQESRQSALGILDRFRYGFADDFGKKQIIYQATGKEAKQLKNGEYGVEDVVNGQRVIRPVDPKGFQLTDLASDISESVGKLLPTGGAIAGGIFGAVPGATAGGAGGEALRQLIGEKMLKVRQQGLQLGDVAEVLAEGTMSGIGEGVGRLVAGKFAQMGTNRIAQNADDVLKGTGEIKPTTMDAFQNIVGMPQGTNKRLLKEFIDPNGAIKNIPHEDAVFETMKRTGNKAINLVENAQSVLNDEFGKTLAKNGIDDSTLIPATKQFSKLSQIADDFQKNAVRAIDRENFAVLQNELSKLTPDNMTYGQLKGFKQNMDQLISDSYVNGMRTKSTAYLQKIRGLVSQAENTLPGIKEAKAVYAPQIQAVKKLSNLMNIKLEQGLAKEGRFTPEMFINRLSGELKDRQLEGILKADDVLSQNPAFKGLSIKEDLLTSLLSKQLSTKSPFTGGRLSLSGIAETTGKAIINPRRRAQMLKGMINSGILNPSNLDTPISTVTPKLSAILNSLDVPQKMPKTLKAVGKAVGGVNRLLPTSAKSQVATRSLNSILFGGQ